MPHFSFARWMKYFLGFAINIVNGSWVVKEWTQKTERRWETGDVYERQQGDVALQSSALSQHQRIILIQKLRARFWGGNPFFTEITPLKVRAEHNPYYYRRCNYDFLNATDCNRYRREIYLKKRYYCKYVSYRRHTEGFPRKDA
jgi:hypothetical protein